MKFAKEIESAACDLPSTWRPYLIHYKLLKKAIRLVVAELRSRGLLDIEKGGGELQFSYEFDGNQKWSTFYFQQLMYLTSIASSGDVNDPQPCIKITINEAATRLIPDLIPTRSTSVITIKLVKDSEFFHMLLEGLAQAAELHATEQKRLSDKVDALEKQLATAVRCSLSRRNLHILIFPALCRHRRKSRKICIYGVIFSKYTWKLPFSRTTRGTIPYNRLREARTSWNGSRRNLIDCVW